MVWNVDPVVFNLFDRGIRYYGIIFAFTLIGGYILWRWQMKRGQYSLKVIDDFILWGVGAVIIGARLGHCFFYHPLLYLKNPWRVIFFWEGGLASHGATLGLVVALIIFALRRKLHPLEIMDRFSMSAAVGAAGIRLGNFMNSEIVGRVTEVPWAVKFPRYAARIHKVSLEKAIGIAAPRHPSQLYEFAMGLTVLGLLFLADRFFGREKRPRGLMTGLFLVLYFTGRFSVEYFKEYQALDKGSLFTIGQILSIVPILAGAGLLVYVFLRRGEKPGHI